MIGMGEAADGPMRAVIQTLTDLVSGFGELPPELHAVVIGAAAITSGLALATGAFLTIMPQIAATRTALETLGVTGTTVKGKLSSLFSLRNLNITGAITLAAGAMYGLLQAAEDAEPAVAELQNTLLTTGDAAATLKTALGRDGIAAAFGDGDYLLKYLDDLEGRWRASRLAISSSGRRRHRRCGISRVRCKTLALSLRISHRATCLQRRMRSAASWSSTTSAQKRSGSCSSRWTITRASCLSWRLSRA